MKWEMEEMQKTACAVIFDMDGTLFDTEVIYGRAWIKAGLTKEQYYQLIGRSRVNIDKILTDWGYDLEKVRAVRSSAVEKELEEQKAVDQLQETFNSKMDDDLNTADAITAIFELVRVANITATEESTKAYVDYVLAKLELLMGVLGIRTELKKDDLDSEVEKLIEERQAARKAKDFARADEIRDQLLAMGIVLKDTREGVKWSRA